MSERDEDVLAEEIEALREQHASTPQAAECEPAPVPVPNGKRVTLGMYVAEYTVRNGWSWWEDTPTHYEHSTGWGILHAALDRIHALEAELVKLRAMVDDCRAIFKAISDVASDGLTAIPRVMDHAEFVRICIEEREKELRAEVARLQVLEAYAKHSDECPANPWWRIRNIPTPSGDHVCTCGLHAIAPNVHVLRTRSPEAPHAR